MEREFRKSRYISYEQVTSLSSAAALTVPDGTVYAIVKPETQGVRFAKTGETLSSSVGYPIASGVEFTIDCAEIKDLRFIEQSASAKLNVVYFGRGTS